MDPTIRVANDILRLCQGGGIIQSITCSNFFEVICSLDGQTYRGVSYNSAGIWALAEALDSVFADIGRYKLENERLSQAPKEKTVREMA